MPEPTQGPTEFIWIQAFADRGAGLVADPSGTNFRPMFQAAVTPDATSLANTFNLRTAYGVFFTIYDVGLNKLFGEQPTPEETGTATLSFFPVNTDTAVAPIQPPYALGNRAHQVPMNVYQRERHSQPGFATSWPTLNGPVTLQGAGGASMFGDDLGGSGSYPWFSVAFDQVGGQRIPDADPGSANDGLASIEGSWHSSVFQLAAFPANGATRAAYRYTLEWTCTPTGESEPWTFRVDPEMIVRPGSG